MSQGRKNSTQQVGYLRFAVGYNDPGIAGGVNKQWLPDGAVIIGTDVAVVTPFNAAATNVLTVGTVGDAPDNIVAAADVTEGTAGLTQNIKPTGAALGPLAAPKQVYATYSQTGTAATAGKAIVIIKYVCDNDL